MFTWPFHAWRLQEQLLYPQMRTQDSNILLFYNKREEFYIIIPRVLYLFGFSFFDLMVLYEQKILSFYSVLHSMPILLTSGALKYKLYLFGNKIIYPYIVHKFFTLNKKEQNLMYITLTYVWHKSIHQHLFIHEIIIHWAYMKFL